MHEYSKVRLFITTSDELMIYQSHHNDIFYNPQREMLQYLIRHNNTGKYYSSDPTEKRSGCRKADRVGKYVRLF